MTPQELHTTILAKAKDKQHGLEIHGLYEAMLMECCENVLQPQNAQHSDQVLLIAAVEAFEVCMNLMRGQIVWALQNGDVLNLNYRGQTFTLDKDSPIAKDALKRAEIEKAG